MWQTIVSYIPDWIVFVQALVLLIVPIIIYFTSKWLQSALGSLTSEGTTTENKSEENTPEDGKAEAEDNAPFTGEYVTDLASIKNRIAKNCDVHFREFTMANGKKAAIIYVEGLYDKELIEVQVMKSLMFDDVEETEKPSDETKITKTYLMNKMLPISEIREALNLQQVVSDILVGSTAMLIDGIVEVLLLGSATGKTRSIEEPLSEGLLRGPRIGFTEILSDNTAILRRHGKNESLELIKFQVGTRAKKDLVVAYMNDIVNSELLEEVKRRIESINMDYLPESGYVEQLIEDNSLSPFQQAQNTERPDRVINSLLEGRVAILLDGSPFALIVPVTFSMLLQSPEDYYERWIPGTLLRMLRFLATFFALFAPALYISFISYHPGLIPTKLVMSIIEARQGVPFPSLIEALIMETSIEILREAGVRLPKPIGPAMGIVGGLIIGDAAVNAGLVSPFLVIVVAVTAISSFAIPSYSAGITLRLLRFLAMFCAAVLGAYGTVLFFLLLFSHLVKLKSFGVPYISPISPYRLDDWKDFIFRLPFKVMKRRPLLMKTKDSDRKK
ncbi:spore germination protein [Paenibacillus macquariensis]|uniref:Spore germination protein n=1 Tax=Paenibacillus macquariensis TaxID=948756 RepID=A0ABY1JZ78_9BACL|nr:spore germination protein [Paenibacillus macquariensis]MEC0091247.1 spore germination protein [Paenibacillus macquariensis]OAB37942.1 spore gernimation protein GerA [Paenibacillus macquariensis subsp. macquariensis]SIR02760.1 spore germination protein [Paenibacillus macquariensis]